MKLFKDRSLVYALLVTGIMLSLNMATTAQTTVKTCLGDTVCLTLSGYGGNIQWEGSVNGTNWYNVSGATSDTACIIADSTSYYRAVVTEGTCNPFYSDTSYVVLSIPVADAGPDTDVCADSTIIGGAPTASGGTFPYTYSWTPTTGLSNPTAANPKAFPTLTTTYTVVITDSIGCAATDSMTVSTGVVSIVWQDEFNGSTFATTMQFPYGDPNDCAYPDFVNFSNNGSEEVIECGCYDEGEMRYSPNLPSGTYTIEMKWRTGNDPHQFSGSNYTNFDDQFGANVFVPKRVIAINGSMVWEVTGKQFNTNTITTINYTGPISDLAIGMGTAGSNTSYWTWIDYIRIIGC